LTTGAISADTNGTLTINAAGMTAQATGTTLNLGVATVNAASTAGGVAAGQVAITATAGNDVIAMGTQKYTITAGAGNDTVNAVTNAVKANDVITGGDGVDELQIGAALAAAAANGVTGFEVLGVSTTGTVAQDLTQFTSNTTFDTLKVLNTGTVNLTNVGAALNTINVDGVTAAAVGFARLIDNTTNAVTLTGKALVAGAGANITNTVTTLTVNDEETININSGAAVTTGANTFKSNVVVTNLASGDLTTLNITGAGDVSVAAGAGTFTLDAVARTVTVNAASATGAVTFDGTGAAANQSLVITGSTANVVNTLTGSAGNDTITGGAGADVLVGAAGADTINGGGGTDTITGGTGVDTLTGGAAADTFSFAAGHSGGVDGIAVADLITDFLVSTDKLQFTGVTDVVSAQQAAVQTAVSNLGASATDAQIATAMAQTNTTNLGVSFAVANGSTYVLFETTGANTNYTAAADVFIKLTGVTTLPTFAGDVVA